MALINRVPQGWLSLLDSKTGGQTPDRIDRELKPTLELFNFYSANIPLDIEEDVANANNSPSTTPTSIVVPGSELWLTYAIEARITTLAAATTGAFSPRIARPRQDGTGLATIVFDQLNYGTLALGANCAVRTESFRVPLWTGPGTEFSMLVCQGDAAAVRFDLRVLYRRLLV